MPIWRAIAGEQVRANPDEATFHYQAQGIGEAALADAYARAMAPIAWDTWARDSLSVKHLGASLWAVEVVYRPAGDEQTPELITRNISWQFDHGTSTGKMYFALDEIAAYGPIGRPAPDKGGAMGLNESGSVEGVDVPICEQNWQETWEADSTYYDFAYMVMASNLKGCVNAAPFRGYEAGAVLFRGATGGKDKQTRDKRTVTYHFSAANKLEDATIGEIEGINKGPWEVLTVVWEPVRGANAMGKRARAVYVDRVADYGDFSVFGIGTGILF
jgi:hypothetical protein